MKPKLTSIVLSFSVLAIGALVSTSCSHGAQDEKAAANKTAETASTATSSAATQSTATAQPAVTTKATTVPSADLEAAAWNRAKSNDSPTAYMDFHNAYPNSKHLTVLTADVNSSYSMSISIGGTGQGTATGGPVGIEVSGHPELSGGYEVETAVGLGIGAKVNADGNIVMDNRPLKNVELFIAQIGGKPRIVAAKQ